MLKKTMKIKKIIIILMVFIVSFYFFPEESYAWLEGYSYRKEITIQATNIDANLTDFPVNISINNDADIGAGMVDNSSYTDIRFTDTTDTVLPFEQESMNIAGGSATGNYWVKTNLDSSSGATIYIYYGKSSDIDGSNPSQVWSNGFQGVWHLSEGTSTATDFFKDSTTNNNDGTLTDVDGDVSQTVGRVGKSIYFTGTDGETDRINVGNDSSLDLGNTFTLSAWVNVDQHNARDGGYGFIISKDEYPNGGSYDLGFKNSYPYTAINTNPTGASWGTYSLDNILPTDTWYYISSVRNSDNSLDMYLDGVLDKTFAGANTPAVSTTDVTFGLRSVDTLELNGSIDELRIENVSRSPEWIKFAYVNMGGESDNELTWGSQQAEVITSSNNSESSSSTSSTSNSPSTVVSTPTCTSFKPTNSPDLFEIDTTPNTATVYFTPILENSRYYISYATNNSAQEHGGEVELSGLGVQSYTINSLEPNTEYFFKVRGQNGCKPGDWSNIKSATTKSSGASNTYVPTVLADTLGSSDSKVNKISKTRESKKITLETTSNDNLNKDNAKAKNLDAVSLPSILTSSVKNIKRKTSNIILALGEKTQFVSEYIGLKILDLGYSFIEDTTEIYEVKVLSISPTQVKISWKTNQPANGKVNYGLDTTYPLDMQSSVRTYDHEFVLSNLEPNTTYNFEVMSQAKTYVYDANRQFTTDN